MMSSVIRISGVMAAAALLLLPLLMASTAPLPDQYRNTTTTITTNISNGNMKDTIIKSSSQLRQNDEATDLPLSKIHKSPSHRFDFSSKMKAIPELQVGCADGNIVEQTQSPPQITFKKKARRAIPSYMLPESASASAAAVAVETAGKSAVVATASANSKMQWPAYLSVSNWKPPTYQLKRPYFIPIYGAPGRVPIYYPPQAINPGSPIDNPPKKPFQGPTYLPPPPTTQMTIEDRLGVEDGRPIWDYSPTTSNSNNRVPTRRPQGGRTTTPPPLVRNNTAISSDIPPPAMVATSQRPQTSAPAATGAVLPATRAPGPSSCVWAIISCCSTAGEIRYDCFEERGCPGAFWGSNPCSNDFARAAIQQALNFYNSKK